MTLSEVIAPALAATGKHSADDDFEVCLESGLEILKSWIHSIEWLYNLYAEKNGITPESFDEMSLTSTFVYGTLFASAGSAFVAMVLSPNVPIYSEVYKERLQNIQVLCGAEISKVSQKHSI